MDAVVLLAVDKFPAKDPVGKSILDPLLYIRPRFDDTLHKVSLPPFPPSSPGLPREESATHNLGQREKYARGIGPRYERNKFHPTREYLTI